MATTEAASIRPMETAPQTAGLNPRRWQILAVLCISLFVIVTDNTIVNVALPTLARELNAGTSSLQWIVDAYTLVFAGLLLAAGGLGDRFGRRGGLLVGLLVFGAFSAAGAFASSTGQLITARALMGVGAAFIFPSTLALIVNVFTDARERAAAIGIWTAIAGVGVALGPISGGWLLEHFSWGSVFLVNVPIVLVGIVGTLFLVPTSRDPRAARLDLTGLGLSIAGVTLLVWSLIEAPQNGWVSTETIVGLVAAAALLASFVWWERRVPAPLLDVRLFRNMRFTAASLAITLGFFALFGFIFLVTQYLQLVKGYSALQAGVRTLPFAFAMVAAAVTSPKVVQRVGTKLVVATGLVLMAGGFAIAATNDAATSYSVIATAMVLMGFGLGSAAAPATESILDSLPKEKAGVGSAVNDTTREVGGTLGVAVLGSIMASVYGGRIVDALSRTPVPAGLRAEAGDSLAAALQIAGRVGGAAGQGIVLTAQDAFVHAFQIGSVVTGAVALAGALLALLFLPARSRDEERVSITLERDPVVAELEPVLERSER
ncbi:MAG TPA: DHA2 family efflux MFS transporter permease subunit [Actinomycetota bacterium]|jgi:EmrB/QacA subfamily drug resistance transporter|nr:DHA2 family efflux MFS transporter permease subunit [Actinomycetota bacterium]